MKTLYACSLLFVFACWGAPRAAAQSIEQRDGFTADADSENTAGGNGKKHAAAEEAIVRLTNEFRQSHDLAAVSTNQELADAARYFARYMAREEKYGHQADGHTPAQRAEEHGYEYCVVLENIAYQYRSTGFEQGKLAEKFFTGWRDSPEHRANMLDPAVTETAVAVAAGGSEGLYFAVQMFGRPKSATIEFRVRNVTGEAVKYVISGRGFDDSYSLPAGVVRLHRVCRPPKLKLMNDEQQRSVSVPAGGEFVIERDAEGDPVLERRQSK